MFDSSPLRRWTSALVETLDALAFPTPCVICGAEGSKLPLCPPCRHELHNASDRVCRRCALAVGPWESDEEGCSRCRGKQLGFDAVVSLGPYQGPIRHLCLQLKSERNAWLAPTLVDLLIATRGATLRETAATCIVAIPLHWRRQWRRGFNQAEALARELARGLGLAVRRPLRRVKDTPHLARMGRAERASRMRHAFRARPLRGETILLVDDILTTGATCGSAARTLKRAGAGRVVAVVIGRAEGAS